MEAEFDNQKRKPLVTVEFQTEVDVATGSHERRMFVKMYFDARDSGLLAAMPGELWKMLCCLATYMDENGNCYPSQALIARDLQIRRQRVNERVQALLNFRFHGQPVLSLKPKARISGRWGNNVYLIHPVSALKIFDKAGGSTMSENPDTAQKPTTVSASTDTVITDTAGTDTNKMERLTRRLNVNDLGKSAFERRSLQQQTVSDAEVRAALERRMLVADILKVCGDQHSRGFYTRVAQKLPADLIRTALSETKYQTATGQIKRSPGALFTAEIMRLAKQHGIDLNIKPNEPHQKGTGALKQHEE